MKRGDIYYANLDPTIGSEIKKKRPVLIISNNANNHAANTVTVLPITSNTKKVYPFEVLLQAKDSGLTKISKVQCHQIRTISKLRMDKQKIGAVKDVLLPRLEAALKLHLDLD